MSAGHAKTLKSENPVAMHFDDEAGNKYQTAYIDGYAFGDRMLEGVVFACTLDAEGYLTVQFQDHECSYVQKLNQDYWLECALSYALKNDMFYSIGDPIGGEELMFAGEVQSQEGGAE
jgi:hypothetical protein